MILKKLKRFVLLMSCIGCFGSVFIVLAGTNSRDIYNSEKTVCAYSKATYTKKTIAKDQLYIYATIKSGIDAQEVTAANPAKYSYKPGGGNMSKNYEFYWGKTMSDTYKINNNYTCATIYVTVDDTQKTYVVFE